jgi:ABC-type branched-subunit amino acid transport system ATPase component
MKTNAGIVPARSGRILLDGQDITRMSPEKRVAMGMGHVPQGRQVFPELTVEENLRLGAYTLRRRQPVPVVRPRPDRPGAGGEAGEDP